jgi:uncharacterized membrane protein
MIPLHTSHGWIGSYYRTGNRWSAIQFFGGMAAPLFLSLAGVSLGLRWSMHESAPTPPHPRVDLARALQLVVLGYLMRLQMWVLDGGGYARMGAYPGELLLLSGYLLAYFSLDLLPSAPRVVLKRCVIALALVAGGLFNVSRSAPTRLPGLLRVDVLQCIGLSLAILVGFGVWRATAFARARWYVAFGVLIAFVSAWTRSWVPGPLPDGLAAYLGQWDAPAGRPVMGLFPLLPWLAYAAIGVAFGLDWARAAREQRLELRIVSYVALGALLAIASSESMPHVFRTLAHHPWLTQPVRVAYRVGIVMVLAGCALAIVRIGSLRSRLRFVASPLRAALDSLGRASLLVYWVHLEFAFGGAASRISKRLDYVHWAWGTLALVAAMLVVAQLRANLPRITLKMPGSQRFSKQVSDLSKGT